MMKIRWLGKRKITKKKYNEQKSLDRNEKIVQLDSILVAHPLYFESNQYTIKNLKLLA